MSNDLITFSCSSCGVELKVPLSFAGVTGPCPACQAIITAPQPDEQLKQAVPAPPEEPAAPVPSPTPVTEESKAIPVTPTVLAEQPVASRPPESRPPLSAPAAAILAGTPPPPKPPITVPSPEATHAPASSPPAPAQVRDDPSPAPPESTSSIPDFSIPSVPSGEKEAAPATDKFPSTPTAPNNPEVTKTLLPPKRAEIELPASLAPPNAAPFPSALIPPANTSRPQESAPTPSSPTLNETPNNEDIPVLGPQTQVTREITPPPQPTTPPGAPVSAPAFLGSSPTSAAAPVPQAEPKSGASAYPVPQPSIPNQEPVAYPTATPAKEAPKPPAPVAFGSPPSGATPAAPTPATPAAVPIAPESAAVPAATEEDATLPVSHGLSTFSPPPKEAAKAEKKKEKKPKSKLWWLRIVIPILFLALCGVVVYLVTDLLQKVAHYESGGNRELNVPSAPNSSARQVAKERIPLDNSAVETTFSQAPRHLDPVSADVAADSTKLYVEGEPPPLTTTNAAKRGSSSGDLDPSDATSVLDRFLNASTFEARLPFLSSSRRSAEELAASSLAGPLPEVLHSRLLHYMADKSDRHTEHFFEVSFQKEIGERPYPILIQINDWGDGQCKIHTDAFLDLFEDELSEFASRPVGEARTFHIVADAYKHCFDEIIPDWDKKSFLKLRNHPRMSPRLIAYFNRNSQMAEEIARPDALPWGESGICTVTVAWNTENPDSPFVELIDVVGFTWEP